MHCLNVLLGKIKSFLCCGVPVWIVLIVLVLCLFLCFFARNYISPPSQREEIQNSEDFSFLPATEVKQVYYVPGWRVGGTSQEEHIDMIREIFPGTDVEVFRWDSVATWGEGVENAEKAAVKLVQKLEKNLELLPNTVIIGHSLGGRVAARAVAELHSRNLQIGQAILIGAAIWNKDHDISVASKACLAPLTILYSPNDEALNLAYRESEMEKALGETGFIKDIWPANLQQDKVQPVFYTTAAPSAVEPEVPTREEIRKYIQEHPEEFDHNSSSLAVEVPESDVQNSELVVGVSPKDFFQLFMNCPGHNPLTVYLPHLNKLVQRYRESVANP